MEINKMINALRDLNLGDIKAARKIIWFNEKETEQLDGIDKLPVNIREKIFEDLYGTKLTEFIKGNTNYTERLLEKVTSLSRTINQLPEFSSIPFLLRVFLGLTDETGWYVSRADNAFYEKFELMELVLKLTKLNNENLMVEHKVNEEAILALNISSESKVKHIGQTDLKAVETNGSSPKELAVLIEQVLSSMKLDNSQLLQEINIILNEIDVNQIALKYLKTKSYDDFICYNLVQRRLTIVENVLSRMLEGYNDLNKLLNVMKVG